MATAWKTGAWYSGAWAGTVWADTEEASAVVRGGGGGPKKYMHWSPPRTQTYKKKELKKLLLQVATTDSEFAKQKLEDTARRAADAVQMIQDIQKIIRELSSQITTNANELEITHQWAQKMVRRIEDERIILLLLLESD